MSEPRVVRPAPTDRGLGDHIESALRLVGVTKERVESWLGRPCGCAERQRKLNQIGAWAYRIVSGKKEKAQEYLDEMLEQPDPPGKKAHKRGPHASS